MHLAFVLQDPSGTGPVTGYVRGLAAALRDEGHRVEVLPDADAIPSDARPVIDAMLLAALHHQRDALVRRGAVALVHHPGAAAIGPAAEQALAAVRDWLPRFGRVVATSAPVAERLRDEFGVGRERLTVVVPGAPDVPRSPGSGASGCAILAVGELAPRKGHEMLLRALARLPDLDWSVTIAGGASRDPAHVALLRQRAGLPGLADRARIIADPASDVLQALWEGADLFALATRWEGYPSAVAEALRRGLPVATTEGAAGALVPLGGGTICAVGDEASLSKCLRRVVFDADLRRAMADTAWQAGRSLPGWPSQAALFAGALASG